jgi:hypothetical protein
MIVMGQWLGRWLGALDMFLDTARSKTRLGVVAGREKDCPRPQNRRGETFWRMTGDALSY